MALPSTPLAEREESSVLALRDLDETGSSDLAIRASHDLDIHFDADDENSLQPRAPPTNAGIFTYYGIAPLAMVGGWSLRSSHPSVGWGLIGFGLIHMILLAFYGDYYLFLEWLDREILRRIDYWTRKVNLRQLQHDYQKIEFESEKLRLDSNNLLETSVLDLEDKRRKDAKETRNMLWEDEEHPIDLRIKGHTEDKLKIDKQKAQHELDTMMSKPKYKARVRELEKIAHTSPENQELYEEAKKLLDEYLEIEDCELREMWTRLDRIDEIDKKMHANLNEALKSVKDLKDDIAILINKVGGQAQSDAAILEGLMERLRNNPNFNSPGSSSDRRRHHRRSNRLPKLINDFCDTQTCRQLWYNVHPSENNKRSTPSDDASREEPLQRVIHDFHLTPRGFHFAEDGRLQRRAGGDEDIESELEDALNSPQECDETVTIGEGKKKQDLHLRVMSEFDGDYDSLSILGILSLDDFGKLLTDDIEKLAKRDISDNASSKILGFELNCGKVDADGGNTSAMVAAWTVSNSTEYANQNPSKLLAECRKVLF